MARSTKQLHKLDQGQQINQALFVLEAVAECGIAGICRNQCLFPNSFFTSRDTGSQIRVTQFNMAALRQASPMSPSESQRESPAPSHDRSNADSRSNGSSSKTGLSSHSVNGSTSHSKSSSSNLCDENYENESSSALDDHCLSPLTSSVCIKTPSLKSCHSPSDGTESHNSTRGNDCHYHHSLLRAEALLLLYWVRQGVTQIMKEGKLARLVFGICKREDDNGEKKRREKCVDGAGIRDRIVESYAFDISKLSKTASGRINQNQVQNAFDHLFRNLQSFSSTLQPILQTTPATSAMTPSVHSDVLPLCFSMASISSPKHLATLSLLKQRYFIIRVEFTQSHSILPQALDPRSSPLNKLAYIDEEKQREAIEPSIADIFNSHVPASLGQVIEKNATGLGIRLTAYCENEDCDNYLQDNTQDDFAIDKKRKRTVINSNDSFVAHKRIQMANGQGAVL